MTTIRFDVVVEAGTPHPISEGMTHLLRFLQDLEYSLAGIREEQVQMRATRRMSDTRIDLEVLRDEAEILDLETVLQECVDWSNETFPQATHRSKAVHLLREARELAENPTDAEEMADVLMLLAHLAAGQGISLSKAVQQKLTQNRLREWGQPDAEGVIEHVREQSEGEKQ